GTAELRGRAQQLPIGGRAFGRVLLWRRRWPEGSLGSVDAAFPADVLRQQSRLRCVLVSAQNCPRPKSHRGPEQPEKPGRFAQHERGGRLRKRPPTDVSSGAPAGREAETRRRSPSREQSAPTVTFPPVASGSSALPWRYDRGFGH